MQSTTARAHGNLCITPAVLRSNLCNRACCITTDPARFGGERKDMSPISVSMRESSIQQVAVVSAEFPRHFFALLRSSHHAGPLILAADLQRGAVGPVHSRPRSAVCVPDSRIEHHIPTLMSHPFTS